MAKTKLGTHPRLYPMPALLIGAVVDQKPDFMTAAWAGVACGEPPMVSVAIRSTRHTLKGIRQNGVFSINVPSTEMVREVDYCGIISGEGTDKAADCGFKIFYGASSLVPLIEQCPVNLECRLEHQMVLGSHVLVIGRILETHVSDDCLTDGKPDVQKIKPFSFTPGPGPQYYGFGEVVGEAFQSGKALIKKP